MSFCHRRDQLENMDEINVCQVDRRVPYSRKPEQTVASSPDNLATTLRENMREMKKLTAMVKGMRTKQAATLQIVERIAVRLVQADNRNPVTGPPWNHLSSRFKVEVPSE